MADLLDKVYDPWGFLCRVTLLLEERAHTAHLNGDDATSDAIHELVLRLLRIYAITTGYYR